jgi:RimJ/RimL family protein N-acetyltransferase
MENKKKITSCLEDIKNGKLEMDIDFSDDKGQKIGKLKPVVDSKVRDNSEIVKFITKLRKYYKDKFLTQFEATEERTKKWLDAQIRERNDKILFMIETNDKKMVGHMGVIFFEEGNSTCELDNIAKDKDCLMPRIMTFATKALIDWLRDFLKMEKIKLRVFSDNLKAQELYFRCGFSKTQEIGLKKELTEDGVKYVPVQGNDAENFDKTMFILELKK